MSNESDKTYRKELKARLSRARRFPHNTCPSSRHAQMIGENLLAGKHDSAVHDDPKHGGGSILGTVAALYECRTQREMLLKLCGMDGNERFSGEVVKKCLELLSEDAKEQRRRMEGIK